MKSELYFEETRQSLRLITDLFDFIWPTSVAMWNLRFMVKGFMEERPQTTVAELKSRFALGSEVNGANLLRASKEISWDQQMETFAKFLLFDSFSIYEAWLEAVLTRIGFDTELKGFQFPTNLTKKSGYQFALNKVHRTRSNLVEKVFYPTLLKNQKNSVSKIENLLLAYRVFKEIRNSCIHGGMLANDAAEDAYQIYSAAVHIATDLDLKELPRIDPIIKGQKINLQLREVVGLTDILIRLMCTIDAELARSQNSEGLFFDRWLELLGKKNCPSDSNIRRKQVIRLTNKVVGFSMVPGEHQLVQDSLKKKMLYF